jgi:hypothetical protein
VSNSAKKEQNKKDSTGNSITNNLKKMAFPLISVILSMFVAVFFCYVG